MKPDDKYHISVNPLPVTIIKAGEDRPSPPSSSYQGENIMNMLPTLILDASTPSPPTASPDSRASS